MSDQFSDQLLAWFEQHGRHDLPWQHSRTPYRVWVSEIMLQQTQVATVIPYYERFMESFPDIKVLAAAKQDDVLHHWTGLGYYARARNLHKAAKIIVEQYQGSFPVTIDEIILLPGIGRSTAGAILSLACKQRYPILDGNVKRVLTRYHAISGWPGKKQVESVLWRYAEQHTPNKDFDKYTQAIMDLGATICTRRNPDCANCPQTATCIARQQNSQHDFPESKPRSKLPQRETIFAIIENDNGEVLLEQRPPSGIWGGLWCFPELAKDELSDDHMRKSYGYSVKEKTEYQKVKHTFSHFHLMIRPVHLKIKARINKVNDSGQKAWIKPGSPLELGFPAPVISMLKDLNNSERGFLHES